MFKLWGTGSQSQYWQETRRELDRLRQEVAELKNELTLLRARSCNLNTLDLSLLGEQYWTGDAPAWLQQPAAALEEASAEPDWQQKAVGAAESEAAALQLPETARCGVLERFGESEAPCEQCAPQPGSFDTSGAAAVQDWAVLKPPSQPKKWWKIWVRKPTYGRSV